MRDQRITVSHRARLVKMSFLKESQSLNFHVTSISFGGFIRNQEGENQFRAVRYSSESAVGLRGLRGQSFFLILSMEVQKSKSSPNVATLSPNARIWASVASPLNFL